MWRENDRSKSISHPATTTARLARAAARAVDPLAQMCRNVPERAAMRRPDANCENEATGAQRLAGGDHERIRDDADLDASSNGARRIVPEDAAMYRPDANRENEATGARRPLSLRQHAAARFLARGYGSVQIARHLGINRHTIGRWKRDPRFAGEVERLRRELTAAMLSPHARARARAAPSPSPSPSLPPSSPRMAPPAPPAPPAPTMPLDRASSQSAAPRKPSRAGVDLNELIFQRLRRRPGGAGI
jgi:hypothetical protein